MKRCTKIAQLTNLFNKTCSRLSHKTSLQPLVLPVQPISIGDLINIVFQLFASHSNSLGLHNMQIHKF